MTQARSQQAGGRGARKRPGAARPGTESARKQGARPRTRAGGHRYSGGGPPRKWDFEWRISYRIPGALRSKDDAVNRYAAGVLAANEAALSIVRLGGLRQAAYAKMTDRQRGEAANIISRMVPYS